MDELTQFQQAVVNHPRGHHAKVCAVAGSGKTSTMVARVRHLVECEHMDPKHICVLMFNREARKQFEEKLNEPPPLENQPKIYTFHSFSYHVINTAIHCGFMPDISDYWIDEKEEWVRRTVHAAIRNLSRTIGDDKVDADDVLECIGLWKSSLIPPERAGHSVNVNIPRVYAEFERLRLAANALTYDDFVPLAVEILQYEPAMRAKFVGRYDTVIVDEYQDVNLGQQTLVKLLAGSRADIMAVGDDDQTIYEWRGARPGYFGTIFEQEFRNKRTISYQLPHSFRFGPLLAQCAQNCIEHNTARIPKPVLAFRIDKTTHIEVFGRRREQPADANQELTNQVVALKDARVAPDWIIVLARLFYQLTGLEAHFLFEEVPYRVVGQKPFFERRENVVLFTYLKLAMQLHTDADADTKELFLSIANVPNRCLTKDMLRRYLFSAQPATLDRLLDFLAYDRMSPATQRQQEKLQDLHNVLTKLHELIAGAPSVLAGDALHWLINRLDLASHYDSYYGKGESAEERKGAVAAISRFAAQTGKNVPEFLAFLPTLDTTRGKPEKECITMTTIFREKGREHDYVVIPNCVEGIMPFLGGSGNLVYDTQAKVEEPAASSVIDNERRLFYVAITRAKEAVYIGTAAETEQPWQGRPGQSAPSRFLAEMQLAPTRTVTDALQNLAATQPHNLGTLITACRQHPLHDKVVANLQEDYLPRLHIPLAPLGKI
jgi:DNA helicase-2/ATP-dependent DNA helicase PcrA